MDTGGAGLTELNPNLAQEEAMLMLDAHSDTENTCGLESEGSEYEETVDEHFACELGSSQGSGVSHDESELSDLRCVDEEHEDAPGHVGWPLLGLRGVVRLPPCGSSGTQAGIIPQSMPHFPHVSPLQIRLCQTPQPELVPLRRNHIRATLLPETSAPMVRRYGTLRCFSATHNVCPVLTQEFPGTSESVVL